MASEAYHDWSGVAVGARLRVNFTLKLLLSQNFCNRPLMRFISFASNIGPAAAVPAGPAPAPLEGLSLRLCMYVLCICMYCIISFLAYELLRACKLLEVMSVSLKQTFLAT